MTMLNISDYYETIERQQILLVKFLSAVGTFNAIYLKEISQTISYE